MSLKAFAAAIFPNVYGSSTTGGKGGGGASLTPEALRLLTAYDTFCTELHDTADELFRQKFSEFM